MELDLIRQSDPEVADAINLELDRQRTQHIQDTHMQRFPFLHHGS